MSERVNERVVWAKGAVRFQPTAFSVAGAGGRHRNFQIGDDPGTARSLDPAAFIRT
jgi:hypothetical protein